MTRREKSKEGVTIYRNWKTTDNQEGELKLNNDEGESLILPTTADTSLNFVSDAIFNGCKFDLGLRISLV